MKRLLMGIVVVGIMLSAGVGSAQQSGSSPELQKWAATHCGQWTGTGHTKDTPMGPGGRWTAKMSVQPLLNGVVVEETYEFDFEGAAHPVRARGVLWYDPARERLVHVVVAADGVVQEGVHTQDTTGWEATSIRTDRSYKVRGSDTHAADGEKFTRRGQMSLDGKNWLPLFEAEFTKVAEISGATTDDEQELIRLEEAFCDAVVKKDVAMVDRLLGEDLTLAMADAIHTKDQAMAYLQSEEFNLASLDPEDLKARIYGDMGVVTGELRWSASDGECGRDRITDIWLKRNGRWQMVATQQSEIEKTVDSAKLSPEMKRLAVFAGDWTYEGEQLDPPVAGLPYGPAGTFSGTSTSRFVLGGRFLQEKTEDHNPAGTTTVIVLTGYDAKAKHYIGNMYADDGTTERSVRTVSDDGRIWTSYSTITTSQGEKVPVRSVQTLSPDGTHSTSTVEVSPDHGRTWKHWFKTELNKVKH